MSGQSGLEISREQWPNSSIQILGAGGRLLLDNASEGIAVIQDGVMKLANLSLLKRIGYSEPELTSRPFVDFIHPDDRPMVAAYHLQRLKGDEVPSGYRFRTIDEHGNARWVDVKTLLIDWDGRPAVLAFLTDITKRKVAEAALREAKEYAENVLKTASVLIVALDREGKVTLLNEAGEKITGYKHNEVLGKNWFELIVPRERYPYVWEEFNNLKAAGTIIETFENPILTKPGEERVISWKNSTLILNGEVVGTLSFGMDITERRKAEQALRASEEKFRLLTEKTNDMIWMTEISDMNLRPTYISPSVERILGFTPEEHLKRDLSQVLAPESLDRVRAVLLAQLPLELEQDHKADPNRTFLIELEYNRKDGSTVWMENLISGVHDPNGTLIGLHGVARDITERREAERTLRDSEERYRLLAENASDIIWVIDANLRFTYVSPSVTSLLGYDAEEFTGRSFDELLTPDSLALMTQVYTDDMAREASTLGSLKERSVEMEAIRKDGSTVWLEAAITPVRDKQGRFTRFQGACRDITERRRAQGVLRESEERFRTLIEKSTDAVAILDANGKLVYESPSMERITGYKLEDWLGKPVEDWLLHPDDMAKMASLLEQLTSHPKVESQDICVRFKHKDGSWHFLEGTARNLLGDPKVKGLVINYRDVTERRQAEELLRNSEERFRGLVETTSDWVWEIDRDFRYTYVSPKVRDILGYEPHELLGHSPLDFMHQTEGRRVAKIVRRFADAHLPFSLLENTCTHKDGRPVVLEASAVPILDSEGGFLGYRGINRDISERKKVEQELKHSLKRLGKTMESIIEAITTTIETRDPYTSGHQMRVTNLACAIARVMELPPAQIEGIRVAGLLHDIGKIAVPTEILTRPGNLNKVEYEMIKTHVQVGYNILKNIEFPSPVARVVLQHHERWNGTGYPNGIRGGDILLEARILAVADVMEAMASDRPYRPSPGLDKALDEITKNSAILYDPAVVNACLAVFSRGGFKFTSSILDVVRESGGMSPDRPVRPLEDR